MPSDRPTYRLFGERAVPVDEALSPPEPTAFGATDAGPARDRNEDHFLVARIERRLVAEAASVETARGATLLDAPSGLLMVVADGIGARAGGDIAAAVTVDAIADHLLRWMPWLSATDATVETALTGALRTAFAEAQKHLRDVAQRKSLDAKLGTTLTMIYARWPTAYVAHVGDSRAYLFRGEEVYRLTRDHNLAEQMVDRGVLTSEEAKRTRFASVLTNAVGGSEDTLQVELHRVALAKGDRLLLCSDGLYAPLDDDAIAARVQQVSRGDLVQPCVEALLKDAADAGSTDNITAVLATF
ncbi:MAG: serine/threonine-protein phosphatase [Myxococcales bacterium]|nr:serine/threonine-protein phosphatase [Myxococcales bacterium]